MIVARAVGAVLARLGVTAAFGVVGSGNFHVTYALAEHGVRFVAARHEGGAATMADAYARVSGTVGVLSVHQGPGLTGATTGIAEAAKSRTPLIVLAGEAMEPRSNFHIDQFRLAEAVGAVPLRVTSAETAVAETVRAFRLAVDERRTVVLNLPLAVQRLTLAEDMLAVPAPTERVFPDPSPQRAAELAGALAAARRPVFVAGRGARHARRELEALADRTGALLATSAVARGLFAGSPWNLDVSGGFASPLTAALIRESDLIVGWGCALNMWTMRHGRLVGPSAMIAQVDLEPGALGAHLPIDIGVVGDAAATARAVTALVEGEKRPPAGHGRRTPALAERIAREVSWRDVPYADESAAGRIDPRTLTIALDGLLPAERIIGVDSGNFMGYPSMFLSVPDENGLCFTQAFQSVGLGLATAIGAAVARPDRLPVAALGDGGALMGASELETVVRLGLPMVIVIYDDEAYGAEVHHFGPDGHPLDQVRFPPVDFASIGRGYGCAAVTVREPGDLAAVTEWLDGPRDRPLLVHARVTRERGAWWLEEAFRGH
ncbi:acetolactate synthase I/II/III large subunit [Sphaerisporangium krabiense]|uniref:Thiamine pyrophosphate-dependent acetolactate synthase large subunit-like protein n=1 Tax=Sphaerisporangium krabiense TaxID=763782 RepID=A0A7W9DTJ6_9ACTN|nr:thiamine pyrophosphate-binding protein [Sphaerisporangium krabiense]MBB5629470.1 thiamine pyrophosphate-dependent acetolactate synthase large subunit-like protein [Sphaerisporangium krabiense]GII65680.1 acetolactate synthase I/II/III large subunit [Sphaerisporangium krabiense]